MSTNTELFLTARPWAERGSCSARDFFNRAAMGRARFLLYTGFIINRAAMGRARFLLCTEFFFFFFFLTARPWAERGSCFTRDLFYFFFVFLSVTRPKPPLGQIVIGALKSRNL